MVLIMVSYFSQRSPMFCLRAFALFAREPYKCNKCNKYSMLGEFACIIFRYGLKYYDVLQSCMKHPVQWLGYAFPGYAKKNRLMLCIVCPHYYFKSLVPKWTFQPEKHSLVTDTK